MAQSPAPLKSEIRLRRARLSDSFQMGIVSYNAYIDEPLIRFLAPGLLEYPETSKRSNGYRIMGRMLSPRNITYVAYPESNPGNIIGQIQFQRLGENFKKPSFLFVMWLATIAWTLKYWLRLVNWLKPDLSESKENIAKFESWMEVDNKRYWDEKAFPERKERWHVQSCVVDPNWQRKGIGKLFMAEVQRRTQEEGVVVAIEATSVGARMYESVGFERLGDFFGDAFDGDTGGGVYMWRPKRTK